MSLTTQGSLELVNGDGEVSACLQMRSNMPTDTQHGGEALVQSKDLWSVLCPSSC